jgi:hypothetical protein
MKPITIELALAEGLRRLRMKAKIGQERVAAQARTLGILWAHSTVAAIEGGRRALTIGEQRLLPRILFDSDIVGEDFTLEQLIPNRGSTPIALAPGVTVTARQLKHPNVPSTRILPKITVDLKDIQAINDMEQKAALRLGISARALVDLSYRRFGHTLSRERSLRMRDHPKHPFRGAPLMATPKQIAIEERRGQALLGHISRQLIAELRPYVKRPQTRRRTR